MYHKNSEQEETLKFRVDCITGFKKELSYAVDTHWKVHEIPCETANLDVHQKFQVRSDSQIWSHIDTHPASQEFHEAIVREPSSIIKLSLLSFLQRTQKTFPNKWLYIQPSVPCYSLISATLERKN